MKAKFSIALGFFVLDPLAQAQVELKTYADANGNIDVQKLTCAQSAGTFQKDADFMSTWYSGWYNGLADFGKINVERAKEIEHRVIVYCKANQEEDGHQRHRCRHQAVPEGKWHQSEGRAMSRKQAAPNAVHAGDLQRSNSSSKDK